MSISRRLAVAAMLTAACGCAVTARTAPASPSARTPGLAAFDPAAEAYVRLVLAAGEHDEDLVGYFTGNPAWREEARRKKVPLAELVTRADALLGTIGDPPAAAPPLVRWRHRYLRSQLGALKTRLEQLGGTRPGYDDLVRRLYGVAAPRVDLAELGRRREALAPLLPGAGSLRERAAAQHERYRLPPERVAPVFAAAQAECRRRTVAQVRLPPAERFSVEEVRDKFWWFYAEDKGGGHTHGQLNVEAPFELGDADYFMCHEVYPGHHVQGVLAEERLTVAEGLLELRVYQTYSPMAFLAEGHASAGHDLALPLDARIDLHRRVLFPLAGRDPADAERYVRSNDALRRLYLRAQAEVARLLYEGALDDASAVAWMEEQALSPRKVAEDTVKFVRTVGAYALGYDLGADLVRAWVDARGGADPADRWRAYQAAWLPPQLPEDLVVARPPPPTAPARTAAPLQPSRFRRVVTGFDAKGKSTVALDGRVPERARWTPSAAEIEKEPFTRFITADELWVLPAVPFDLAERRDPVGPELASYGRGEKFLPHRGSVVVEEVRYDPGGGYPMHTSASLDVIVVTSGAMELILETGSTVVRAGDVVIQRGTPHAWKVVGDQPCTFVSILADAVNSPVPHELLMK